MIEFQLDRAFGGWQDTSTPDNLEITVTANGTTHQMEASLRELLQLYGATLHSEEVQVVVGTGSTVQLVEKNGWLRFKKYPLDVRTTYDELQEALENLIKQVFQVKNQKGSAEEREDQLAYLEAWLEKQDVGFDVNELYRKLRG